MAPRLPPNSPLPPPLPTAEVRRKLTSQPDDASAYLSHHFCEHRLDLPAGVAGLDFQHLGVDLGTSAFNMLSYGAEVSIASSFDEFYMLEMPLDGGVEIEYGQGRYRSQRGVALLLSPGPRFVSRWQRGTRQAMLQIHREQLRTRLAQVLHRRPSTLPIFNPVIDLRSEHGRKVQHALAELARMAEEPSASQAPPPVVIDTLIDAILQNMAYRVGDSLRLNRIHATPRQLRRAHEILSCRYAEKLSMADVAQDVGMSERSLFDGFQRYFQRTPYQVLTDTRMEAARTLLRQGTSAHEASQQVGFPHPGRFAAAYRQAFGHPPSQERRTAACGKP